MKLRSLALAGAMMLACALPVAAQTAASLPVKDSTSTTRNIAGQTDASGSFHYRDIMEGLTGGGTPDAFLTDGSGHQLVTLFGTPTFNLGTAPTLTVTGPLTSAQLTSAGLATASGVSQLHTDLTQSGGLPVSGPLTAAQLAAAGLATTGGKVDTVIVGSSTDRGAVVGTTAVTLLAANIARRGFSIQVQSASSSCYMNGLGTATADYHSLQIGGSQPTYYETKDSHVGQGAVSLICTAASTPVYAREW